MNPSYAYMIRMSRVQRELQVGGLEVWYWAAFGRRLGRMGLGKPGTYQRLWGHRPR